MKARVNFQGRLRLIKDTGGTSGEKYRAVIEVSPRADVRVDGPITSPPHDPSKLYEIEAPLRKEQYEELMKALESSEAESPRLAFDGGIEVSVEGDCIN